MCIVQAPCGMLRHHNSNREMNRIKEVLEEKGIKQKWLAEKPDIGKWIGLHITKNQIEAMGESIDVKSEVN